MSPDRASSLGTPSIRSEINVTPLVDVCLVLLIIFMVVTPMLQTGTDVPLPETASPDPIPDEERQVTLALTIDGRLTVDGREIERNELVATLTALRQVDAGRPLVLKADRDLPYRTVRELLGETQEAGFAGAGLLSSKRGDPAAEAERAGEESTPWG